MKLNGSGNHKKLGVFIMDKIYIFGAGNNAYGVISYVGFENVIAIIDNEKKKQGDSVLGLSLIHISEPTRP